jgi:hypothetical protein
MRHSLLLCSLFVSTAAFATPSLELEVSGGAHGWMRPDGATFGGRVGLDLFDWFTPGVRAMTLDKEAWALLGDLRAHTPLRLFQLNGGVGIGFALAKMDPAVDAQRISPYLIGDIGVRLNFWRMWVGFNVGGSPFDQRWLGMLSLGIAPFGRD